MKFDWQIAVEVVQDNSVQCVFLGTVNMLLFV